MVFTATVILNIVVMSARPGEQPPDVVTYSPLLPPALLLLTGLYLFALPHVARRRAAMTQ
jgi:hypothetical protein